jgi:hypothetical protein
MVVIVKYKKDMLGLYFIVYTGNRQAVFAEDQAFDAFIKPF